MGTIRTTLLSTFLLTSTLGCGSDSKERRGEPTTAPAADSPRTAVEKYPLLFEGCQAGWWESCIAANNYLAANEVIRNTASDVSALGKLARKLEGSDNPYMREAVMLMQINACRFGAKEGCVRLAATTPDAPDAADAAAAVDALTRACEAKDGEACRHLGVVTAIGVPGLTPNLPAAVQQWTKGCDAGAADACLSEGLSLYNGAGVAADRVKGKALMEKACQGKYHFACYTLIMMTTDGADNNTVNLSRGTTKTVRSKAWQNAHDGLTRLCREGYGPACFLTTSMRERESPTQPEWREIVELQQIGCDHGSISSCTELGYNWLFHWSPPKVDEGVTLLEQACKGAQPGGCRVLGYWYAGQAGMNGSHNDGRHAMVRHTGKARTALDKACLLGNADSCQMAELFKSCEAMGYDIGAAACQSLWARVP